MFSTFRFVLAATGVAALGACGARSGGIDELRTFEVASDAGATTGAEASAPGAPGAQAPKTCAAAGGTCRSLDATCGYRMRSLEAEGCEQYAECCAPVAIPKDGECWDTSDCTAASTPPGRPASTSECVGGNQHKEMPGKCACTTYGVTLLGTRCGPILQPGEQFLCTTNRQFVGSAGSCGGKACAAGSACFRGGDADPFVCSPDYELMNGTRDYCAVVNCGDIRCDPPLRCEDPARSACGK